MTSDPDPSARILVADDQRDILEALRLLLTDAGYEIELVTTPAGVLDLVRGRPFDLVLLDLNYSRDTTSGGEGLELISRVRAENQALPVVVMTGWGSIETAVDAMRRGARSFVQKPWEDSTLLEVIARELAESRATRHRDLRQEREQEEARQIQRGLLPAAFPQAAGYRTCWVWRPAGDMSGDCFDATALGDGRIAISIADVMGKGLPAALLMSNLQAAVRAFGLNAAAPRDLCASVNRLLCRNVPTGRFVTFCYCVLDTARRSLTYANAGHNPPALVHADGSVERLDVGGTVLGVFPDSAYEQAQVTCRPGDRLVLYTDGITESTNASGEEFGEGRVLDVVRKWRDADADTLQQQLIDAVTRFNGGSFADDATLIVVAAD
jgi:sigma-B regulation protein RsbU (phosphoserine phosphatase)